jgi:ectoine hydroxylase-related dioxygenase (phytanoyl-CoA dioxygenase family)
MWRGYWRRLLAEETSKALFDDRPIDPALVGELRDSAGLIADGDALRVRMEEDGYLFLRGLVDPEVVRAGRERVFARLAEVDEIADPVADGVFTGRSQRRETHPDTGHYWKSVSDEPDVRAVTNGETMHHALSALMGEPARGFDYIFLRAVANGHNTNMHCDNGFFSRTSQRVVTNWMCFTAVPRSRGGLFVVEGSHRWPDLRARYEDYDVARDKDRKSSLMDHPEDLCRERGTRLLTTNYEPGDVLAFSMFTLHGAFDQRDAAGHIRLTCDVRYQPAADALDPRYFGDDPTGTTGSGYGELNAARPMNEDWHVR